MKKPSVLSLFIFLVLLTPLMADDIGFVLTSKNAVDNAGTSGINFSNSQKLQVALNLELGTGVNLNLGGYYQFALSVPASSPVISTHSADLTDLALDIELPKALGETSVLNLQIGRLFFYDFSAMVLAHSLDGVMASWKTPDFSLRVGIGTSALQFNANNAILIASKDKVDANNKEQLLAPARLLGILDFSASNYLPRQNFQVGVLGQTDLRSDTYRDGDNIGISKVVPISTLYLGVGLDGRLAENLFYKLVAWGEAGSTLANNGTVYRGDTILAGMADLSLKFFLKESLNSQFELGMNASSGDLDFGPNFAVPAEANVADQNTFFSRITGRGGGYIHTMGYGNSLIPRFSYFFKPVGGRRGDTELGVSFDYLGFFRIVNGYIAEPILVSGTNQAYLGSEFDVKFSLRLVSDLGISLRGGVFLPNAQAITKMSTWKAGLELSLGM